MKKQGLSHHSQNTVLLQISTILFFPKLFMPRTWYKLIIKSLAKAPDRKKCQTEKFLEQELPPFSDHLTITRQTLGFVIN